MVYGGGGLGKKVSFFMVLFRSNWSEDHTGSVSEVGESKEMKPETGRDLSRMKHDYDLIIQ